MPAGSAGIFFRQVAAISGCACHAPLAYCIPEMSESRSSSVLSGSEAALGRLEMRAAARPTLAPIDTAPSFKQQAYTALKNAIVSMDVYRSREDIRLDERRLAQ